MSTQLANAFPRKEFFVQMFTKDISLEDCILDMVDNCIDGLIRTKRLRPAEISKSIFRKNGRSGGSKAGLPLIKIEFSQNTVSIKDNCGGIPFDYALSEAFNFGHSSGHKPGYLGVYGVGLKRALFKIGSQFRIESSTTKTGFTCDLDVTEWVSKDKSFEDWKVPLTASNKARSAGSAGTTICITDLHDEVKLRLKDNSFETELFRAIQQTYTFFLKQYVCIKINGQEVKQIPIPLGKPKQGKASFQQYEKGGVTVRVVATVAHPDKQGRLLSEASGWYIACNGRIVLAADKSERTGWGLAPMPQYHSKFRAFIGFVFFESKNPALLPWTTTKRGLNKESAVFLSVKNRMAVAARPVISFCNRKYGPDVDEEPIEREISKEVTAVSLGNLTTHKPTAFEAALTKKVKSKTTTKVQYDADNSDLDKIKKHFRKPRLGASKIGRRTFEYFLKREGLK